MTQHRHPFSSDRDLVGPDDSVEDVTHVTDRDLILRAVHEVLVLQHEFGRLVAHVSSLAAKQDRDAEDITVVRNLRADVKTWKRRAMSGAGGIIVLVAGGLILAYLAGKFGLKLGGP